MLPLYGDARLDRPSHQIRLLRYQPHETTSQDSPHYSLETFELDHDWPVYVAISYTWGHIEPTFPVVVNGHVTRTRLNCWYALWQLRYHQSSSLVWIDSLCIDQENGFEKSAQVGMMGQIYEKAASVAACIGDGDVLARLSERRSFEIPDGGQQMWSELDSLSYFNRLWIKQEVILAANIQLYCGLESREWDELADRFREFRPRQRRSISGTSTTDSSITSSTSRDSSASSNSYNSWQSPPTDPFHHLLDHRLARLASKPGKDNQIKDSLFDLLRRYGDARCVDFKDKVYALLSLLPCGDVAREQLKVNYTESSFDLFRRLLVLCFQNYGSMEGEGYNIFALAELLGVSSQSPEVARYLKNPSAPTLASLFPSTPIPEHFRISIQGLFNLVETDRIDVNFLDIVMDPFWSIVYRHKIAVRTGVLSKVMTLQGAIDGDWCFDNSEDSEDSVDPEDPEDCKRPTHPRYTLNPSPGQQRIANVLDYPVRIIVFAGEGLSQWELLVPADINSNDLIAPCTLNSNDFGDNYMPGNVYAILRPNETSKTFCFQGWAMYRYGFWDKQTLLSMETNMPSIDSHLMLHHEDVLNLVLLVESADIHLTNSVTNTESKSYATLDQDSLRRLAETLEITKRAINEHIDPVNSPQETDRDTPLMAFQRLNHDYICVSKDSK